MNRPTTPPAPTGTLAICKACRYFVSPVVDTLKRCGCATPQLEVLMGGAKMTAAVVERLMQMFDAPPPGVRFYPSRTEFAVHVTVRLGDGMRCTCKGWLARGECAHVKAEQRS